MTTLVPMTAHHRLLLRYRGSERVHRWAPACVCGWQGVFRRRRKEAEQQYRDHLNGTHSDATRRKSLMRRGWRAPTALADLPEMLR